MVSKRERSEIGRLLASLRARVRVPCAYCGKLVTGSRRRRYCSPACRQAAYRRRKAGQEPGGLPPAGAEE
jgi:hypothetical protein